MKHRAKLVRLHRSIIYNRTFELGEVFGLRIRRVTITYDIIACKNKTAKLKSAKWN